MINGEQCVTLADHFTFFTQSAGDHANVRAPGDVARDGSPVGDALIIGVRVHEQQPGLLRGRHACHASEKVGRLAVVHEAEL